MPDRNQAYGKGGGGGGGGGYVCLDLVKQIHNSLNVSEQNKRLVFHYEFRGI